MIKDNINRSEIGSKITTKKLVTFDIFDTLLTRMVCSPIAVFYFVGKSAINENLVSCSPGNYIQLRREAERLSRIGHPDGEIDDNRIFKFFTHLLGVSEEVGKRLRELEIEWESKFLIPVPGAHELLMKHRNKGDQIAFVSDMYWTKEILIDFLKAHDFWRDDDQLWVSSEHGASKASSKLFEKVLKHNQIIKVSEVHHYGNNKEADNDGAIKAGLSSTLLLKGNPTRYENLLERFSESSGGLTSLLSGAGRLLRMKYSEASFKNAGIARIVGNVAGPCFTLYVMWLLRSAKAEGVKHLYFVSRDGYVPFKIAEKISGAIAPGIKISYLYGSRQAWHIAGLFEFDENTFYWLFGPSDGATAASVMKRAGIEWEELCKIIPGINEKINNPHSEIQPKEMDFLKSLILSNKILQERILNEAKSRRELLLGYLDQEGFNPNEKSGMVEIGWGARTRMSFERAIGIENSRHLHWFYLGLGAEAKVHDPERIHTFLYGPLLKFTGIEQLPVIAESFCLAPHGSVLGFSRKNEKVMPIFKEGIEAKLEEWGRSFYLSALNEYCDNLPVTIIDNNPGFDLRSPAYFLLKEFSEKPGREDALIWGNIPFEHDQSGSITYTLAPKSKLNYRSIKEAIIFGTLSKAAGGGQVGAWGAGAWSLRSTKVFPLFIFVFIGHMRVNGKSEIMRVLSETKSYLKRVLRIQ